MTWNGWLCEECGQRQGMLVHACPVKALRAEIERLADELDHWRKRGSFAEQQWELFKTENERLRALEVAARVLLRGTDIAHPDGDAAVNGLLALREATEALGRDEHRNREPFDYFDSEAADNA